MKKTPRNLLHLSVCVCVCEDDDELRSEKREGVFAFNRTVKRRMNGIERWGPVVTCWWDPHEAWRHTCFPWIVNAALGTFILAATSYLSLCSRPILSQSYQSHFATWHISLTIFLFCNFIVFKMRIVIINGNHIKYNIFFMIPIKIITAKHVKKNNVMYISMKTLISHNNLFVRYFD